MLDTAIAAAAALVVVIVAVGISRLAHRAGRPVTTVTPASVRAPAPLRLAAEPPPSYLKARLP